MQNLNKIEQEDIRINMREGEELHVHNHYNCALGQRDSMEKASYPCIPPGCSSHSQQLETPINIIIRSGNPEDEKN